ncbi:MAG TPA: hypothetical protein VMT80_00285 [Candidatus Paceibacterota bacterium]|nr:hypothetical protein [Candidatus Paceibacterota bacterium]
MLIRSGITARAQFFKLLGTIDNPNYKSIVYIAKGPVTGRIYAGCGAAGRDTLIVVDPTTRTIIGSLTDGTNLSGIDDVTFNADETTAFVSCENGSRGVSSINITNPASMSIRQTLVTSSPKYLNAASGICNDSTNKVLLIPTLSRANVAIVDYSGGDTSLTFAGEYQGDVPGTSLINCRRTAAWPAKKLCFFGTDNAGASNVRIGAFDYTTLASPVKVWQVLAADDPNDYSKQTRGVFVDLDVSGQERLYSCSGGGTAKTVLSIWDISQMPGTPTPTLLGFHQVTGGPAGNFGTPRSIVLTKRSGKTFVILTGESGHMMLMLNVTDPTRVSLVGQISDSVALNQCMGVTMDNNGNIWTGNFASNGLSTEGLSVWQPFWPD